MGNTPVEVTSDVANKVISEGIVSVKVVNLSGTPKDAYETPINAFTVGNRPWKKYYENADDLPNKLNERARTSTTNSRILTDKSHYITGEGFTFEGTADAIIDKWQNEVNGENETLRDVHAKVSSDFARSGVAYLEIVKLSPSKFFIYHKDYSACRLGNDGKVWVSANFQKYNSKDYKPTKYEKFPNFGLIEGVKYERSIIQIKRYESGFPSYGLPDYFSAYVSGWLDIDYWIPKYNFSRFKNGFNPSGLLVLVGNNMDEAAASQLENEIVNNYTGEGMNSKLIVATVNNENMKPVFTKFNDAPDGAFDKLQDMANENIILAHGYHPALLLSQAGKLSNASDIRMAYEMAMVRIRQMQETITSGYKKIFGFFGYSIDKIIIANAPPVSIVSQIDSTSILTIDEQRVEIGKDELPNGEGNKLLNTKVNVTGTSN